jgi:hypothetical protein
VGFHATSYVVPLTLVDLFRECGHPEIVLDVDGKRVSHRRSLYQARPGRIGRRNKSLLYKPASRFRPLLRAVCLRVPFGLVAVIVPPLAQAPAAGKFRGH